MTDKEIRTKLINKLYPDRQIEEFDKDNPEIYYYNKDSIGIMGLDYDMIFSHSFAKAFWGEELNTQKEGVKDYLCCDDPYCCVWIELPLWKFHLQQMVLEEEPLKYLEKFL